MSDGACRAIIEATSYYIANGCHRDAKFRNPTSSIILHFKNRLTKFQDICVYRSCIIMD